MRRALLRALLGSPLMTGDGLRRPVNAPATSTPPVGIQPGTTQQPVVRLIVFGPGGQAVGVFVYSGTPALGNPPVAWISLASTDPYGNALPATTGIVIGTQDAGTTIGLGQGELIGYATGELPGSVQFPGSRTLRLISPTQNVSDTAAILSLIAASTTGTGLPRAAFNGQVVFAFGSAAAPSLVATDVWHPITSFGAGFAAGSPAPAYLLLPWGAGGGITQGAVALRGVVDVTAATVVGASMFTLPYTFTQAMTFVTQNTLAGYAAGRAVFSVNPGGSVTCSNTGANGNVLALDGGINYPV